MIAKYFKRLRRALKRIRCSATHQNYWEVNTWNTAYCKLCEEEHNKH